MEGLVIFLISVEIGFNHFREGKQTDQKLDRVSSKSIRFNIIWNICSCYFPSLLYPRINNNNNSNNNKKNIKNNKINMDTPHGF